MLSLLLVLLGSGHQLPRLVNFVCVCVVFCLAYLSVLGDRAPEEVEEGGGAQDEDTDGLHQVPFSVDRSNSAHLAYFSGSVEDLLEHSGRRHRRGRRESGVSAFLR